MFTAKKIKKLFSDACVYFTAAEFVILVIAEAFKSADPLAGGAMQSFLSLSSAALIFLACVIMSAMNRIFTLELSSVLKVLIHFIGSLVAYTFVFIIIPGAWGAFEMIFARLGVFVMLYAVILLIAIVIGSIKSKRRSDDSEYESQFGEFFIGEKKK